MNFLSLSACSTRFFTLSRPTGLGSALSNRWHSEAKDSSVKFMVDSFSVGLQWNFNNRQRVISTHNLIQLVGVKFKSEILTITCAARSRQPQRCWDLFSADLVHNDLRSAIWAGAYSQ